MQSDGHVNSNPNAMQIFTLITNDGAASVYEFQVSIGCVALLYTRYYRRRLNHGSCRRVSYVVCTRLILSRGVGIKRHRGLIYIYTSN